LIGLQDKSFKQDNSSEGVSLELHLLCENYLSSILETNNSENPIKQKPRVTTARLRNYVTSSLLQQNNALNIADIIVDNQSLETNIVNKFKKFKETLKIYICHNNDLTIVKILLAKQHYDYELMDKIFNEAEFPIKDTFQDKLIDFEYIPFSSAYHRLINSDLDKLIFDRKMDDVLMSKGERLYSYNDYSENQKIFNQFNTWQA
jgi:hypothetical protein